MKPKLNTDFTSHDFSLHLRDSVSRVRAYLVSYATLNCCMLKTILPSCEAQHSLNLCRMVAFQSSLLAPPAARWLQELGSRLPTSCLLGRICLLPFCVDICFVIYLLRPSRIHHKIQELHKDFGRLYSKQNLQTIAALFKILSMAKYGSFPFPAPFIQTAAQQHECYIPSAAPALGSAEVPSDVSLGIGQQLLCKAPY